MSDVLRPNALRRGDRVAIVAPAGPFDEARLREGEAVLAAFGWESVAPEKPRTRRGYLADSDEARAAALQETFADPSVRAVVCARGGFGTTRLLDRLDPAPLRADPKPLVGFSDATALLSWAVERAGVVAVHGPVVTQLARVDAPSHIAFAALLGGAIDTGTTLLEGLTPLHGGVGEGTLRGGNLTLLGALAGTPHGVPLAGTVLLLEDTNEPVYKIDRLLTQLRAMPGADELAGIVLGDFDGLQGEQERAHFDELCVELAAAVSCPVVRGAPVGHGRRNVALPLGLRVQLDADSGRLLALEPPLRTAAAASRKKASATTRRDAVPTVDDRAERGAPDVDAVLREAVASGVCPAAALWVRHRGKVVVRRHMGWLARHPKPIPIVDRARFDLASLTKAFATTTIAMRGVAAGWLDLDEPVAERLPWLAGAGRWDDVRVHHLLQHAAGIPDWAPLFALARRAHPDALPGGGPLREVFRDALVSLPFHAAPGTRSIYSDLGFLLLAPLLELAGEAAFGALFLREVAAPLGLTDTGFRPTEEWDSDPWPSDRPRIAATEDCPWRGRVVWGGVHDENAYALGGVAGHAGLFSSVDDVGKWAGALLDTALDRPSPLELPEALVTRFWDAARLGDGTWSWGWDHPAPTGSSAGRHLGPDAVGHLGFTGCSVWIDRERDLAIVLLSNRVHPSRHARGIRELRPALHDRIVETFTA